MQRCRGGTLTSAAELCAKPVESPCSPHWAHARSGRAPRRLDEWALQHDPALHDIIKDTQGANVNSWYWNSATLPDRVGRDGQELIPLYVSD